MVPSFYSAFSDEEIFFVFLADPKRKTIFIKPSHLERTSPLEKYKANQSIKIYENKIATISVGAENS